MELREVLLKYLVVKSERKYDGDSSAAKGLIEDMSFIAVQANSTLFKLSHFFVRY